MKNATFKKPVLRSPGSVTIENCNLFFDVDTEQYLTRDYLLNEFSEILQEDPELESVSFCDFLHSNMWQSGGHLRMVSGSEEIAVYISTHFSLHPEELHAFLKDLDDDILQSMFCKLCEFTSR